MSGRKRQFISCPACNQNAMEDNINIDLKEIMYNWRYEEAVHAGISSVKPRESFIRELAAI